MKTKLFALFLCFCGFISAQETHLYNGPFRTTIDDRQREYIYYAPSNFSSGSTMPCMFLLHGLGQTYNDYDEQILQSMANKYNAIILMPQALPEQDATVKELVSILISTSGETQYEGLASASVWGADLHILVSDLPTMAQFVLQKNYLDIYQAGKITLNEKVDDVKFINQLISMPQDWQYDENQIYIAGCSLGGAMTYRYAFSANNAAKKIAVASGFISKGNTVPANYSLPTLVIHSKTDEIVPYEPSGNVIFSQPTEQLFENIKNTSHAEDSPIVSVINEDKNESEQITVTDFNSDPRVTFYAVNNASHNLAELADYGVDVYSVIGDFLFGAPSSDIRGITDNRFRFTVYPNPATDKITFDAEGEYSIYSLTGALSLKGTTLGDINVSDLAAGQYILNVKTDNTIRKAIFTKE